MKTITILILLSLLNYLYAQEIDSSSFKVYFQTAWNEELETYQPVLKLLPKEKEKLEVFDLTLNNEDTTKHVIYLEGHTDEWGSDEYNYSLGLVLVKFVRDKIQDNHDKKALTFSLISLGESKAKEEFIAHSKKPMINYNTYVKVSMKKKSQ